MPNRLKDKRVLVTQADDYMGPPIVELFHSEGAEGPSQSRFMVGQVLPFAGGWTT